MGGIPNPDSSTQQVGPFGVLGNTGLSALPNMTRANVEYALKQRLKNGSWKDSSDEFWTGVDPDGVSPWSANYTRVISSAMKGEEDPNGTTLPELTQDLNNYMSDKWNLLATGAIGGETGGGTSVFVNFASYSNGTSLPAEWDQLYSGSGTGTWGIAGGKTRWYVTNSSDRECVAVYGAAKTVTNYQKVGMACANTPGWFNNGAKGWNYLYARMNEDGDEYVYAMLERYYAEIGCVAGGVKTVLASNGGFSFRPNVTYWLSAGTTAGAGEYTYQLLENAYPLITISDTTYSIVDEDHRYAGMGARANESGLGSNSPAQVLAWGFGDSQPASTIGSGAIMIRTSGGNVSLSSGSHALPSNFFQSPLDNTADIFVNIGDGSFTVAMTGWYWVEWKQKINNLSARFQPWLYRNGTAWKPFGNQVAIQSSVGGFALVPEAFTAGCPVYLAGGTSVSLGYDANASSSNALTGESTGVETTFTIALMNRSRE